MKLAKRLKDDIARTNYGNKHKVTKKMNYQTTHPAGKNKKAISAKTPENNTILQNNFTNIRNVKF
jgi:hypothetical protein